MEQQTDWYENTEKKSSVTLEQIESLGREIVNGRAEVEAAADVKKELEKKVVALEQKMLEVLHETGRHNFPLADGTNVYIHRRLAFTIPKTPEQRIEFFNYLRDKGVFDNMITVNHNTLNSYCKAEYEAAEGRGELVSIPGISAPTEFESIGVKGKK